MNIEPLVSVIIPTHNRREYIVKAIESVLSQTYKNIEIIVVDDYSIDGTYELIFELSKKYKKIIPKRNEINLGPAGTANVGISVAHGKYIAILDDDDTWRDQQKLEKQIWFLEKHSEYVLTGGGLIKIDNKGKEIIRYLFPEKDEEIRQVILVDNLFAHSTVVYRKDAFEKVGGYTQKFGFFADMDLWLKLGTIGKFYNFQEYFTSYLDKEEGENNYSGRDNGIRRRLFLRIAMEWRYRKVYPGILKSIFLCIASYIYSYLPYRKKFWRIIFKIRILLVGPPSYKYFKPNRPTD